MAGVADQAGKASSADLMAASIPAVVVVCMSARGVAVAGLMD